MAEKDESGDVQDDMAEKEVLGDVQADVVALVMEDEMDVVLSKEPKSLVELFCADCPGNSYCDFIGIVVEDLSGGGIGLGILG